MCTWYLGPGQRQQINSSAAHALSIRPAGSIAHSQTSDTHCQQPSWPAKRRDTPDLTHRAHRVRWQAGKIAFTLVQPSELQALGGWLRDVNAEPGLAGAHRRGRRRQVAVCGRVLDVCRSLPAAGAAWPALHRRSSCGSDQLRTAGLVCRQPRLPDVVCCVGSWMLLITRAWHVCVPNPQNASHLRT